MVFLTLLLGLALMASCSGTDRTTTEPVPRAQPDPKELTEVAASPSQAHVPPHPDAPTVTRPCPYVFPIRPAGVARYGASHHDYPATDIFAPAGTEAVAPTDGVVDYVSRVDLWKGGVDDPATRGGLSFAIVGDDGVRYYGSHLRDISPQIAPGSRVSAGQVMGHVGNSGNARGTPSHLHFGISHPTTPEDWLVRRGEVSPYEYLNTWKAGKAVTPRVSKPSPPRCLTK